VVAPGALQAEANATAAGDIPDNQVFLVFRNGAAAYNIKYPEGWAQQGKGNRVTFRDKNNIVRVIVGAAATPTKASVQADVRRLSGVQIRTAAHSTTIAGKPAFKVVYSTESAPNAVTGKRLKLVVDRYYLWQAGRRAVIDLGTPQGVDNVDAYRLMIESFRWS
jgi:asparagine N-glycosylation enzyme membrane subunit Stt3